MSDHSLTNEQAAIDALIEATESQSLTPYPILGNQKNADQISEQAPCYTIRYSVSKTAGTRR